MASDTVKDNELASADVKIIFHPLAVFKDQYIERTDNLHLPIVEGNPAIMLNNTIYLRSLPLSFGADEGQLLSYSLIERSWNAISTPVGEYELAICSNSLVLVSTRSRQVLVLKDVDEWDPNVIPWYSTHLAPHSIMSVASSENLLFIVCKLSEGSETTVLCCDVRARQWKNPCCNGPSVQHYGGKASIFVHHPSQNMYAMLYSPNTRTKFAKASISSISEGGGNVDWTPINVVIDECIPSRYSKMFSIGNQLMLAALDRQKMKLFTMVEADNGTSTMADIDELTIKFGDNLYGVTGCPDGSLVVIADVCDSRDDLVSHSSVMQLKSAVLLYDCNKHFNMIALKRLERVAKIRIFSNKDVTRKLPGIKTYAGFKLSSCSESSQFAVYMHSWLHAYKNEQANVVEPTWSNLLNALRSRDIGLTSMADQIEELLKTAPVVVPPKASRAIGLEEIRKLQNQLKSVNDLVKSKELSCPQKLQEEIDSSYSQCCVVARTIEDEQSTFVQTAQQSTIEREKLLKENSKLMEEIKSLKTKLAAASGATGKATTTTPPPGQSGGTEVIKATVTAGSATASTSGQAAGGAATSSATLPPSGQSSTVGPVPAATATAVGASTAVTSGQGGSQVAVSPKYKKLSEFSNKAEHKVRRVICNEVFEEHLKKYLDKIGMDFQELKETYMDDAFQKAVYDYSDVEVECDSLHEFPLVLDEVGYSFEWPNTTDADESHVYDKEISYVVGNELMVTNSSEWSICGGLSATYQGVGATANIGYTKRQSEIIKKIKTTTDKYRVTETVTVPPRSKVKVAIVQNYQKKECKVKNVKLTFPKNAEVKCKAKNRQTKSDKVEKPEYPIKEVLKDFVEDQDADPLTARLDGKYVWVETGLALNKGKPEPI